MTTTGSTVTKERDATRLLIGIRALVRRFSLSERADTECCGMTVAQSATLETLLREGPMRLGGLGRRLGIQPSTLTRNFDRLEERGFVMREPDPEDARASRAALTREGERAAAVVGRRNEAFAKQVLERLAPERRQGVVAGFEELLSAVHAATESCCPGAFEHLLEGFPKQTNKETD